MLTPKQNPPPNFPAVSITVLLQLWPNMLLSACPGKTALWFGAAGVALDSYIPLVHSLGQTLPGYLPFVDKALNFV